MNEQLFIGLMSGTSMDGIDATLVDFTNGAKLIASHSEAIPSSLKDTLQKLTMPGDNEIDQCGQADVELGKLFANAALQLISKSKLDPKNIKAIGSHGQAIRHRPNFSTPFTLQIADPNTIAALTGITTVADFRRKDMALGGQGAPLAPAFHATFLHSDKTNRIVLNIGGIANITVVSKDKKEPITGFDTGPGNRLLDAWIQEHKQLQHDKNGDWARSGKLDNSLLKQLLQDPYFHQHPPKSTGREYFHYDWLIKFLDPTTPPQNVQRTLVEFTAQSIVDAIEHFTPIKAGEIIVCGGGVHNTFLMERLATLAKHFHVMSSLEAGIDPDWLEAIAFAWFAKNTLEGKPSNIPSVTGASRSAILGGVYYP